MSRELQRIDAWQRALQILQLLEDGPLATQEIAGRLARRADPVGVRAIEHTLAILRRQLGSGIIQRQTAQEVRSSGVSLRSRPHRVFYRLAPEAGLLLVRERITAVTAVEAMALATARDLLSVPGHNGRGPLGAAIDQMMSRLGLHGTAAQRLVPDHISVPPSAALPVDPAIYATVIAALRRGDGLAMTYERLDGHVSQRVVNPLRLLLAGDEPHLWAWDGDPYPKNFTVARIRAASLCRRRVGQPPDLDHAARQRSARSFDGIASDVIEEIDIVIAPSLAPAMRDRRLGLAQRTTSLRDGSLRVRFRTAALQAVRVWLLGCGDRIEVLAPDSLRAWMAAQGRGVARRHQHRSRA